MVEATFLNYWFLENLDMAVPVLCRCSSSPVGYSGGCEVRASTFHGQH